MAREELRHVRDIKAIRVARPGGLSASYTLAEAAALTDGGWDEDEELRQHVAALAKSLLSLQSQRARVALESLAR